MFTGIIEALGQVKDIRGENANKHFTLSSPFTNELKIDQSVAHNGVCLTVVEIHGDDYTVTAIDETLQKTNLNDLQVGDEVNLERCMQANGRFDGHIVQGHVDQTAVCESVTDEQGSWLFTFRYDASKGNVTVEKGSICINGISLTVVNSREDAFSVAIIPYTMEHTNLKHVKPGTRVNLEFDIIGKYVARLLKK
ncbi:MAG: riboflavin synthase [Hymenobacteraceae bacterium]|nr:riboflavin synthase [Hymenobacteraceae bacterium]